MKKKILLLGGTGVIGEHLQSACLRRDYDVTVTSRSEHSQRQSGLKYVKGNAFDQGFIKNLLKDNRFDAIVDFMVYRTDDFRQRVPLLLKNTDHYVYLSSYRVFSDNGRQPLTEASPRLLDVSTDKAYLKTDEYALAKARQEDIIRAAAQRNWTIVRPSITYGKNRLQLGCLEAVSFLSRAKQGLPVVVPKEILDQQVTMTWAGDAAEMIASIILMRSAMGEDYNVLTNESRSWGEIIEIYKSVTNLNVRPVNQEKYLSLGLNRYQLIYDRMCNRLCDNKKIMSLMDTSASDLAKPEDAIPEIIMSSDIPDNTLSRLHGRMDSLLGINRTFKARSLRSLISYLIGHTGILNWIFMKYKFKRSFPEYKEN